MSDTDNERDISEQDYQDRLEVLRDRVAHLVVRDRRSVESAAERLVQKADVEIGHTAETAAELLATVVDPRSVQASQIRQQRVRGSRVLSLLRTTVWTPLLLVDATNGRFVVGQTYLSDPRVGEVGSAHLALPAPESPPMLPSLIYRGSRVAVRRRVGQQCCLRPPAQQLGGRHRSQRHPHASACWACGISLQRRYAPPGCRGCGRYVTDSLSAQASWVD